MKTIISIAITLLLVVSYVLIFTSSSIDNVNNKDLYTMTFTSEKPFPDDFLTYIYLKYPEHTNNSKISEPQTSGKLFVAIFFSIISIIVISLFLGIRKLIDYLSEKMKSEQKDFADAQKGDGKS